MKPTLALAIAGMLALAACGAPTGQPDTSAEAQATATPVSPASSPAPSPTAADTIPVAAQGRWGLVAEDCNPQRADNKGLITVSDRELRFYESVAKLGKITESSANHIRATYAFSGEGMEWTRDLSLTVEDNGTTIVREEFGGGDALPGPLRYSRCE